MNTLRRISARPETALVVVAIVAIVACWVQHQVLPTIPQIQDEFSYLLAADTFSKGRLTNPPHVLWRHFETTHVIQLPTYQSKYPPGQGLALALGQSLTGSPLIGVWISVAVACAAVCWMLQAWLPLPWAFVGGLLAATHGLIVRWWGGTYMGGAVAMLAGALLFGGLARALKDPRPRHGLVLALGLALLALTRPYEGLIASLPAAFLLLRWLAFQKTFARGLVWKQLILPMVIALTLATGWLAYYNYRVTRSPYRLPYQVYLARYGQDAFANTAGQPLEQERLAHIARQVADRFQRQASFHMGATSLSLFLLAVALPGLLKNQWARLALLTSVLTILAASLTRGAAPHYSAPVTPLVLGLMAQSLAGLRGWAGSRAGTRFAIGVFLLAWVVSSVAYIRREAELFHASVAASRVRTAPEVPVPELRDWDKRSNRHEWERFSRGAILARPVHAARLAQDEKRHLVVVRYHPDSNRHREWVYNRADIDGSKVVWAMDVEGEAMWPLLEYYKERRVWLVEPESRPYEMLPFPVEDFGPWYLREHEGAAATVLPSALADDPVRVEIAAAGNEDWHVQIERAHPAVVKDGIYVGSFRARADEARSIWVDVSQGHTPWRSVGFRRRYRLGPEWETFRFHFRASRGELLPRLVFGLGNSDVAVEISGVEFSTAPPTGAADGGL